MKRRTILALMLVLTLLTAAPPALAAGTDMKNSVAAGGESHGLAVKEDGSVLVWGSNDAGQLGLGSQVSEAKKPTLLPGVSAVSVCAGADFSVAVKYDGTVYTWGHHTHAAPARANITGVAAAAAGGNTILALKSDGTVWQWSYGGAITQVTGLSRIAAVSTSGGHHLALAVSGEVYAWGENDKGQLGDGTSTARTVPARVPGLVDIVDIAAGFRHSLCVSFGGSVYAWGANDYGQLGIGGADGSEKPVELKDLNKVIQVAAGDDSSMALTQGGTVYAWGYGEYGQLGNSKTQNTQTRPYTISMPGSGMSFIAAGRYHDLAVTNAGVLYAWGRNKDYQLGSGKNDNASSPVRVQSGLGTVGSYAVEGMAGISGWARASAERLYETELVPPMLWGGYTDNITRAEFAHLLVSVYERVKSTTAPASSGAKFTDIQGHPLETDLRKACGLGILSGTSETTLSPDRSITREEAAKMLCGFAAKTRGSTISTNMQSLAFYQDAGQIAEWAVPYVYYAHENSIMEGNAEGGFAPKGVLTREQSLVIMARLVDRFGWAG